MPRIFGLRNCLQEVQDSIQLFGQNLDDESLKDSQDNQNNKHDHQENMWHVSQSELTLGSFEALDIDNIPDEMDDTTAHQCDKDDDVDKENEPPVTPLESPNNTLLVPPQVFSLQKNTRDENLYQPESVVTRKTGKYWKTTTEERKKKESYNRKTPPTGELPEYNKSRKQGKRRFHFHDQMPRSLHARSLDRPMLTPRRPRKKHPGLRQVLSPKALYSSGPPGYEFKKLALTTDNAKMVSHSSGGSSSSTPMSSSSSAGGSSSCSGSSRMGSKRSTGGLNHNNNHNGELDLENLEYPDSPTSHKWFADNSDLSPLTVLDNINLKTEFPYSTGNVDIDKPPDINSITLDSGAETLFQFAASVPNVPDNTTTFLDIGADTFSQSLYDDLGDINMNDFPNVGAFTTTETVVTESPVFTMVSPACTNATALTSVTFPTTSAVTSGGQVILTKPVTLEKLQQPTVVTDQHGMSTVNLGDLVRLKSQHKIEGVDVSNCGNILHINTTSACNNQIQLSTTDQGISVLKGLIEPLPASALKGLIKIEPDNSNIATTRTVQMPITINNALNAINNHCNSYGFIKVEQPDLMNYSHMDGISAESHCGPVDHINPVFSPLSLGSSSMASPGSPNSNNSGGGKMKGSPSRKKSTSTNTDDEDDISNIPSLQTRIQIISQRLGIPPDVPIELINGGHGIKNPLSSDLPEKTPVEKLPPIRPESDPAKFQCRLCSKMFTLQRLLNRHMKCHSDTKRYLCTFCGKGFNDTFDLKRHTRTHTGVRPYKCNLCEKSFTQRCSLESHCLKVHGVAHQYDYKQRRSKMYVCEDCGHTTAEPEVHYLHLKDNHPFSPALHKFYDKRHFKFTNSNFASMLLQVNS